MLQREDVLRPGVVRSRRVSRWLAMMALAAGVVVIAGASIQLKKPQQMSECERAVRNGEPQHGVELCLESYERTGDPFFLSQTAQAYLAQGELERAGVHARQLLGGPREADGHRILSSVLLRMEPVDPEGARTHASAALAAYARDGNERGQTSAAIALSQVHWKLGYLTDALEAADQALLLIERLNNVSSHEVSAHWSRADALRRMGDVDGARAALKKAGERATSACEKTWTSLKTGLLELELDRDILARLALEAAAETNRECKDPAVAESIDHATAWRLRKTNPADALARLDALAKGQEEGLDSLLLRGHIAADDDAFGDADKHLVQAESADEPDADWLWEVALARAQLAELHGGLFSDLIAEYHYRRAILMIAELRSRARARDAYLVSSHRGPYDGLIALLARTGRWQDALAVILELDASDMLRATTAEVRPFDRTSLTLGAPVSALSAATAPAASVEDVLAAWRSRDLVIVIAPEPHRIGRRRERAYRLRVTGGQITGEDIGDANAAQKWATELYENPANSIAARQLGALIVPPDRTTETLDVLAIGPLGKAPLAALRDSDGALIISRRPLARVLALRAAEPSPSSKEAPAVLGDPEGNLPYAALEGYLVTSALAGRARHSGAYTATPATRARLWEADRTELLHVASHVSERGRWRALRLADGVVTPDEIVKHRLAPRLAVLASCGSAASLDVEGWGSIAAALLQAGTQTVIATDRNIPDAVSFAMMRAFYAQPDWSTDPVRALTRVQHAASSDPATYRNWWAAFTVLQRPPS